MYTAKKSFYRTVRYIFLLKYEYLKKCWDIFIYNTKYLTVSRESNFDEKCSDAVLKVENTF